MWDSSCEFKKEMHKLINLLLLPKPAAGGALRGVQEFFWWKIKTPSCFERHFASFWQRGEEPGPKYQQQKCLG